MEFIIVVILPLILLATVWGVVIWAVFKAYEGLFKKEKAEVSQTLIEKVKGLHKMQHGLASESPTPTWVRLDDVLKLLESEKV